MLQADSSVAASMESRIDIPQPGLPTTEKARPADDEVRLASTAYA